MLKKRTKLQGAGEIAILLSASAAGASRMAPGIVVVGLGILLLFVSDRGQHRWLADQARHKPRGAVIFFSVMAHLVLNMVAVAAAYIAGALISWVFGLAQ